MIPIFEDEESKERAVNEQRSHRWLAEQTAETPTSCSPMRSLRPCLAEELMFIFSYSWDLASRNMRAEVGKTPCESIDTKMILTEKREFPC